MAGTDNTGQDSGKKNLQTAREKREGEGQMESIAVGDASGTPAEPIVAQVPVSRVGKNTIVFTDRFVTAIGGNAKFVTETPSDVKGLPIVYPKRKTRQGSTRLNENTNKPPVGASSDRLLSRGGKKFIVIPKRPYRWHQNEGTADCKEVLIRVPTWYPIMTVMWALTNLIIDPADWPKAFYNYSRRRVYALPKTADEKITLADFGRGEIIE